MKRTIKQLTCKISRKKFPYFPLLSHTTKRAFCSEECLPDGVLDEYGVWDYVDYVYLYRDYLERFEQRNNRDLLNDIEETMDQMGEYILCDTETVYVR